ncbi:MAG TPA: NAD(P)-binding domain-containing protein [Spirochaetota bacterium]
MQTKKVSVGIIGAGHLGLSLAKTLIRNGYDSSSVRLSYTGKKETYARIKEAKLENNISSNDDICRASDIIFITIRPSDILSLSLLKFNSKSVIVSCIAGVTIDKLMRLTDQHIVRVMPSSPMTIEDGKGICAIYPENKIVSTLLSDLGVSLYPLSGESLFDIFTASICLPAAYLQMEIEKIRSSDLIVDLHREQIPWWEKVIGWTQSITPTDLTLAEKHTYIERMATKGGVTEAMIHSLKKGSGLIESFTAGVKKSEEISRTLH